MKFVSKSYSCLSVEIIAVFSPKLWVWCLRGAWVWRPEVVLGVLPCFLCLVCCCVFRQGLPVWPWLALELIKSGWHQKSSTCLWLPNAEVKGMCHHAQLHLIFWDRVSHWTWSSLASQSNLNNELWESVSTSPVLRSTASCCCAGCQGY